MLDVRECRPRSRAQALLSSGVPVCDLVFRKLRGGLHQQVGDTVNNREREPLGCTDPGGLIGVQSKGPVAVGAGQNVAKLFIHRPF